MKKTVLLLAAVLFANGCSVLGTSNSQVQVDCKPEGSVASVNGENKTSPASFDVVRNKDIQVACQKPGYLTSSKQVGTHLSGTGTLDVIGAVIFLIPAIGLITPGAWDLDQTEFNIELVEDPGQGKSSEPVIQ